MFKQKICFAMILKCIRKFGRFFFYCSSSDSIVMAKTMTMRQRVTLSTLSIVSEKLLTFLSVVFVCFSTAWLRMKLFASGWVVVHLHGLNDIGLLWALCPPILFVVLRQIRQANIIISTVFSSTYLSLFEYSIVGLRFLLVFKCIHSHCFTFAFVTITTIFPFLYILLQVHTHISLCFDRFCITAKKISTSFFH